MINLKDDSDLEARTLLPVLLLYNKFYHHIIKYSSLTFLRCHFTEGKKWGRCLPIT